jgi:tetratricopeptide (TPR) repeat protein
MSKMPHFKTRLAFIIAVISVSFVYAKITNLPDLDELYKKGQFSRIAAILESSGVESLSSQDKMLFIECLTRSAQRNKAERLFHKTMAGRTPTGQIHTTAGIVCTAWGQFSKAKEILDKALALDPECPRTWMAVMMNELYLQNDHEARDIYEKIEKRTPEWKENYLFHLLGIEVYSSLGNMAKMAELYARQSVKFKKTDKKQFQNFQKNARLYRKGSKQRTFQIQTTTDRVAVPFVRLTEKDSFAVILLTINDKPYRVLLDTGNRAGWTIHSLELRNHLKNQTGATVLTQIGGEEGLHHGHLLLTKQLAFKDFTLDHLSGMYVPKPQPGYPEANLNPLFIKNRMVSLDFRNKELILRTKERFQKDLVLVSSQPEKAVKLPWYGYEQALFPVKINAAHEALAMIETGAEDVTINLDFALRQGLDLKPAIKYLPSGKEFPYHKTSCLISIGRFKLQRQAADVWFFDKLVDPITGLMPDVLLGPEFFEGRHVLTFDPFQKKILISDFSF